MSVMISLRRETKTDSCPGSTAHRQETENKPSFLPCNVFDPHTFCCSSTLVVIRSQTVSSLYSIWRDCLVVALWQGVSVARWRVMNITLTHSSFYPFAAVQVCPSVIDFPRNLHIHSAVVHHVHGPLLQGTQWTRQWARESRARDVFISTKRFVDLASKFIFLKGFCM